MLTHFFVFAFSNNSHVLCVALLRILVGVKERESSVSLGRGTSIASVFSLSLLTKQKNYENATAMAMASVPVQARNKRGPTPSMEAITLLAGFR